jgi:chemotaxis protein CheD
MGKELIAGMGEFVVSHNDDILISLGLGSCVGVAIMDDIAGIGGLAHIMLPTSKEFAGTKTDNMNKFADIAIPAMIGQMVKAGCLKSRMKAKIAGGAHMFPEIVDLAINDIGKKNSDAVIEVLTGEGIPIISKEIGGHVGRTVRFDLALRKFFIKTKEDIKEI